MNDKEVAEIRRRFRPDKSNITHVRGCYVNDQRDIVSEFNQPMGVLPAEESGRLLDLLKRALSGKMGRNLIDIPFENSQVAGGDEHQLLMKLRNSELQDDQAVHTFFKRVTGSVAIEGGYLVLLARDAYDVPRRGYDGELDAATAVYSYILCAICPMKQTKPALSYQVRENGFQGLPPDWYVGTPELGFLFPAFDDRGANLYAALQYTHSVSDSHEAFVQAVLGGAVPMPAALQKETFQAVMHNALAEDCKLEVVQAVHDHMIERIAEHKESGESEPLRVTRRELRDVLTSCSVPDERIADFERQYEEGFGPDTELCPHNLVTPKIELTTPEATVRVDPERGDLVKTRVIDGIKYILIRADTGATVNGVDIHIM